MSNASGWGLTARLVSKHFGVLGNRISEAIANFDPETATEADRDRLAETLRETAQLLASSRAAFDKEHNDVVNLRNLIANDERATETLAQRLAAGTIAEATVTMFCDELEANKGRLPQEIQEEADAKAYMDELQKIVDALSKQLSEFDAQAKKAMQALASAKAQKDLQEMRMERQQQLAGLSGMQGNSTALSALTKRAQSVSNEAAGLRIVADIGQKPLDQQAEIDAIRKSVSQPQNGNESALDRLKRLSGKPTPPQLPQ
jgi:signal transduction protein with GAF and PtsI domain